MLTRQYLELVKSSLLNELHIEMEAQLLSSVLCAAQNVVLDLPGFWKNRSDKDLLDALREARIQGDSVILEVDSPTGRYADSHLRNYTEYAYTLVGRRRMDHLQSVVESVIDEKIPGDLLEAGVWRGGCCILMRAILSAHECHDRNIWLCDSFKGLPKPTDMEDLDFEMGADRLPFLAVTQDEVRDHFRRFNLLNEQVKFVSGWFNASLRTAPIEQLALLRIDVDLFESTLEVLTQLYPKVSSGGWVIIDDYQMLPPCRKAVDQYRRDHQINEPIDKIDRHAICWRVP